MCQAFQRGPWLTFLRRVIKNMNLSKSDILFSIKILKELLANTYVLSVKTQGAHWNVEDTRFHMLHNFFSEQYSILTEKIDEIAERIRMLGEQSPSSMSAFLDLATLKETDHNSDGKKMLQQLTEDHHAIIATLRKSIELVAKTQDQGTLDFLIGCLQLHEKMAWMTGSHIKT